MSHNSIDLDDLHEMFTTAGIEHRYTPGDLVISVIHGPHAWTVSENSVLYWGDGIDVCKSPYIVFSRTADAYDYIADVYSEVQ